MALSIRICTFIHLRLMCQRGELGVWTLKICFETDLFTYKICTLRHATSRQIYNTHSFIRKYISSSVVCWNHTATFMLLMSLNRIYSCCKITSYCWPWSESWKLRELDDEKTWKENKHKVQRSQSASNVAKDGRVR